MQTEELACRAAIYSCSVTDTLVASLIQEILEEGHNIAVQEHIHIMSNASHKGVAATIATGANLASMRRGTLSPTRYYKMTMHLMPGQLHSQDLTS